MVVVYVDGIVVEVEAGGSLLEACDMAGKYVPRLCAHPVLGRGPLDASTAACGLCVVRLGDGSVVQACSTEATPGTEVATEDAGLRELRTARLAAILARHPHLCLSCPDREGCSRDICTHGLVPESRCCERLSTCELGLVIRAVDPQVSLPRREVAVSRSFTLEGRIRREPGLCVSCRRCVSVCASSEQAGAALEMVEVARPKQGTLRDSGCTFCGLCVLVCPTGALTAPGAEGAKWLAARREKHRLPEQPLPFAERRIKLPDELPSVPSVAGVLTVFDGAGKVLCIAGVPDLAHGVARTLDGLPGGEASSLLFEIEPLYTQREAELLAQYSHEHGHMPVGNDLGDDLFVDDPDL